MVIRYAIMYGSYRADREGMKAALFIKKQLEGRGDTATIIDAKQEGIPFLDKMYVEFDNPPENIERVHQQLESADAVILIAGEYNHSIQPGLKNLLDHFQKEYFCKPCGVVTYSKGHFAGTRVSTHLRVIAGELGMVTPSTLFGISSIHKSLSEDGIAIDESYNRRVEKFLQELDWYTKALKKAREDGLPF